MGYEDFETERMCDENTTEEASRNKQKAIKETQLEENVCFPEIQIHSLFQAIYPIYLFQAIYPLLGVPILLRLLSVPSVPKVVFLGQWGVDLLPTSPPK